MIPERYMNVSQGTEWLGQLARAVRAREQRTPPSPLLIARPLRNPQESRPGYLLRVAESNSIAGISQLGLRLGAAPSELLKLSDDGLSQVFRGVPIRELAPSRIRADPSVDLIRHRLWSRSRICPECVRTGCPASMVFDMPLTLQCEVHGQRLVDTCPRCEEPLTYFRRCLDHCDCGQPLAKITGEQLGPALDLFKLAFSPWRAKREWSLRPWAHVHEEMRSALAIRSIILSLDSGTSEEGRAVSWLATADWPIIEKLLTNFPATLTETITDVCRDLDTNSRSDLLGKLDVTALPHLLSIAAHVREDQLAQRSEVMLPTPDGEMKLVTKAKIRETAKVDSAAADFLIEKALADTGDIALPPRGTRVWVPGDEVDRISAWIERTADQVEAGEILGCPPDFVVGLYKAGLLAGECLPAKPRSPRFERVTLDKLLLHLIALRKPGPPGLEIFPVCRLSPGPARKKYWRTGWQRLMRKLLAGSIPSFEIEGRIGWASIGVRPDHLATVLTAEWKQIYVSD